MRAYYNENDPFAAGWLRNLISAGHIAPGDVDERDIRDVMPTDLAGFKQAHFFAGVSVWSLALRLAGWPDDRPVWTGSCPCQPFSAAGQGGGEADERHLWPAWFHLVRQCRPPVIYGEQVGSKAGLAWFDLVSADMEGSGYAVGANDSCSAGVGAPHIRQRLWFVAERLEHSASDGREERRAEPSGRGTVARCGSLGLGHADSAGLEGFTGHGDGEAGRPVATGSTPEADGARRVADADGGHARAEGLQRGGEHGQRPPDGGAGNGWPGPVNGFWRDADWLHCRDGKWRPVRPGSFPLAHGVAARVGKLRAYGNAINPEVAAAFIAASMDPPPP